MPVAAGPWVHGGLDGHGWVLAGVRRVMTAADLSSRVSLAGLRETLRIGEQEVRHGDGSLVVELGLESSGCS